MKTYPVRTGALRHEVWGSGSIAPRILNMGFR
jgi:hypothetical protein